MDDAGNVSDAEFHVVEFRGFEKFCEGRPYSEMPGITPRICGICPVSHLLGRRQGGRRHHGGQHPAGGGQAAPADEPRPDHPEPCPELLPPERAGLPARLGHAPGQAQRVRPDRLERRPGPRRHPAAPVRPGDHPDSGRPEDPSGLGRARRRPQRPDRGGPRPHPRLAARGVRHDEDRPRPLQEGARDAQEGGPDLRQLPLAVHGPGGAGRRLGASRRQAPFHRQQRQHHRRPARSAEVLRVHRRIGADLLLPQVALLQPAGLPGRHVSRRPAGPARTSPSRWARPRPMPS